MSDLKTWIEERRIGEVECLVPDMNGVLRGKVLPAGKLVVEEGGFLYDSDAYNDDLPYWTMVGDKKHLVIPYSLVNNDSRFSQGHFGQPEDFEEHLRYTFDRLYKEGATHPKMMSIGLHMRVAGHPGRAGAVAKFIAYAKSHPDVWFARRIEIAKHWQENHA